MQSIKHKSDTLKSVKTSKSKSNGSRLTSEEHKNGAPTIRVRRGYLTQVLMTSAPLLVADLLAAVGACVLATVAHGGLNLSMELKLLSLLPFLAMVFIFVYLMFGLYPGNGLSPIFELRQITIATTVVFMVFLLASLAFSVKGIPAIMPVTAWLFSILAVPVMRSIFRKLFARFKWWGQPVLIFGGHDAGILNYRYLATRPYFGLKPVGIIDDSGLYSTENVKNPPAYLGTFENAPSIANDKCVFWAVVAMPERSAEEVNRVIKTYVRHFPHVLVVPELDGLPSLWNRSFDLGGVHGIRIESNLLLPIPRLFKRLADLSIVIVGGIICLPMIVIIAALVKLSSPGPIVFFHERISYNGRRFKAWKFRTMFANAADVLDQYLDADPEIRKEWEENHKLRDDPRVTKVGRWLRKTSLDELPQLWNIVRGEMSLVGPRPIVEEEIKKYGENFGLYTRVVPGLTGLWQVSGRNNTTYDERVHLDSYYVRNWSPWMDIYILARTIKVVLRRDGAY
jgi:Undecaprenyl-phosphate galactose phosphotransferase WbaP